MGDFDDMNATPLGKLPMPSVQSKADGPRIDGGTSYADILKNMTNDPPSHQPQQQQPVYSPAAAYSPASQITASQYYAPRPAARKKQPGKPRKKVLYSSSSSSSDSSSEDDSKRYKSKKRSWLDRLKDNKTSILVTLVVLMVLLYVSPRLAQMVPSLLSPAGKFNFFGLFVISTMCGGIHRVADTYIKFK